MTETERRTYLNQIRRLQEQNTMLLATVHQERRWRQEAYSWYRKRLRSRFNWVFDYVIMMNEQHEKMSLKLTNK